MSGGEEFAGFVLTAKLDAGGMAEVWLAQDSAGREVAIKRLLPAFRENPQYVAMLKQEGDVARKLDHQAIVRTLDVVEAGSEVGIVMERLRGMTLLKLVQSLGRRKQRPSLGGIVSVGIAAAEALSYFHHWNDGQGLSALVHRDINPANLFVESTGIIKLIDFGLVFGEGRGSDLTQMGEVKGKIGYFAPEQARLEAVTGKTDVFALAVSLYELIAWKRFWGHVQSDLETIKSIAECDIPADHFALLPPGLQSEFQMALTRDDVTRCSAEEFAQGLRQFALQQQLPIGPEAIAAWFPPKHQGAANQGPPPPPPRRVAKQLPPDGASLPIAHGFDLDEGSE